MSGGREQAEADRRHEQQRAARTAERRRERRARAGEPPAQRGAVDAVDAAHQPAEQPVRELVGAVDERAHARHQARPARAAVGRRGSPPRSRRLARNGTIVARRSNEARIVNSTAAGSERMKSPAPSGRNSSGTKASSSVAVQPSTASQIWSVAAIAAWQPRHALRAGGA